MSYILDALKRAERERKQGQVSVLDEIPSAPVMEPQRRLPRLLIPIAAGVVAVALVVALIVWRHHGDSKAAQPPVAVAPLAPAPPPPPVPAQAPPQPPTATIEDSGKLATLDDVYQAPPQGGPQPGAPPAGQFGPPPGPPPGAAGMPQRRSAPPADLPQPDTQGTAPPDAGTVQSADVPPPDAAAPDVAPPPAPAQDQIQPAPQQQRQLKEMPENFRANFPAFTVDVHAYNSDPNRRFVLIGGKRYREGDTLAEGPRIVGIVPEGIVFDWQGQQVLYAIAR